MSGDKPDAATTVLSKEDERWESIIAALATILDKFDDQGAHLTTLSDNYDTLKANQGRLHAAVNNVQSKELELAASTQGATHEQQHIDHPPDTSAIGGRVSALLNATTHKLRFPKYDGSDDPLPWLHCCEQFFQAVRTPETEKVWLASFYMQGAAQHWYYRLEWNQGTPTRTRFTELANTASTNRSTTLLTSSTSVSPAATNSPSLNRLRSSPPASVSP
jgi:hypothetical protein